MADPDHSQIAKGALLHAASREIASNVQNCGWNVATRRCEWPNCARDQACSLNPTQGTNAILLDILGVLEDLHRDYRWVNRDELPQDV